MAMMMFAIIGPLLLWYDANVYLATWMTSRRASRKNLTHILIGLQTIGVAVIHPLGRAFLFGGGGGGGGGGGSDDYTSTKMPSKAAAANTDSIYSLDFPWCLQFCVEFKLSSIAYQVLLQCWLLVALSALMAAKIAEIMIWISIKGPILCLLYGAASFYCIITW